MKLNILSLLAVSAVASPLSIRATTGTTTYTSGNTANDVTNGVCAPLTVIFARGTGESGNIGSVIGPPLFAALSKARSKNVALQGVNYPADAAGNANLGASGGPTMASLAQQALSQCPTTKIALAGYSQGGLVVHYALNSAGLSSSSVSAITYFGDPGEFLPTRRWWQPCRISRTNTRPCTEDGTAKSGTVPASKIKEYCASGDGVCERHGFYISSAHLSYGSDATDASNFIITTTGVGTN